MNSNTFKNKLVLLEHYLSHLYYFILVFTILNLYYINYTMLYYIVILIILFYIMLLYYVILTILYY